LEHDVGAIHARGAPDHAEDVRIDQEVLPQLVVRAHAEAPHSPQRGLAREIHQQTHHQPNRRAALRSTSAPSSATEEPRSRARNSTVWATKAGWFRRLRTA